MSQPQRFHRRTTTSISNLLRFAAPVAFGCAFAIVAMPAVADGLAALGNVTANGDKQAAEVTIGTGGVAVVPGSTPLTGANMAISNTAYDEVGNRLFVADQSSNELLTINMADGSVITGPSLSGTFNFVVDLEYDASEDVLYGIVSVGSGDRQLATFNLGTGAVTLLGSPIGGESIGTFNQPFDLDTGGNRYYFLGVPSAGETLYAINTATGAVADSVLISPLLPAGVNNLVGREFDPGEGVLYALAGLTGGDKQLGTVNASSGPAFGTTALLGSSGLGAGDAIAFSGHEALDAPGNRYFFTGSINGNATLFQANTATGALGDSDTLTFGAGLNDVRGLEYDGVGSVPVELQSFDVD